MSTLTAFILGCFVAATICALLWGEWQFMWTLKHGLRADLFTLDRKDVLEELTYVVRERERRGAKRQGECQ